MTATELVHVLGGHDDMTDDGLPSPDRTPFRIDTAESLLLLPDPEWLIDGIIQENSLALIYGPSGCGKSFLALDLAHHLALKRPWFGYEIERRAGVLYIAAEASGGVVKRVKAFRQHYGIARDEYCPLWFIRSPVDLLEPTTVDEMETTWATWGSQFEVIVVDTLSRCIPGGNENAPEVMTTAVNNLDRIRERLNATIIVIHHSPLSVGDRPRGHSSLFAAADTALTVEASSDHRTAKLKYQRDGEEGQQFGFSLQQLEVGQDKKGRDITSCVVEPSEITVEQPSDRISPNLQTMFAVLAESMPDGLTADEWTEKARAAGLDPKRKATFWDWRKALKDKKRVHDSQGKWFVKTQ